MFSGIGKACLEEGNKEYRQTYKSVKQRYKITSTKEKIEKLQKNSVKT